MDTKKIIRYALSIAHEYYDECDEINQTALDEAVQDHFDLSDKDYHDEDISFLTFKELERRKMLTR
jgi:hypothetical protein